jgi:hypothetical protein
VLKASGEASARLSGILFEYYAAPANFFLAKGRANALAGL